MPKSIKVGEVSDLAPGEAKSVDVEGQMVALFNVNGTFYAIDDSCSHVGGPLGEGALIGKEVTCPWHSAQFDVTTGKVLGGPAGSDVQCYKVTVEGNEVFVEVD